MLIRLIKFERLHFAKVRKSKNRKKVKFHKKNIKNKIETENRAK
jgi:hypothetical protein